MHLLVAVSHHGLGHLAQVAPVLNRLAEYLPALRLTLHSGLPKAALAARIRVPFSYIGEPTDCGMGMHDALRVDRDASLRCYMEFHRDWAERVRREADRLCDLGVDAVFSDVGYLCLAAAQAAGIRSAAMCSLNWADIAEHYLAADTAMAEPIAQMRLAYRKADFFLRLEPAMPMPDLTNAQAIAPVAAHGMERRAELRSRIGLPPAQRLVLVGMGGIAYTVAIEAWPDAEDITWLMPAAWCRGRPGCVALEELSIPYIDLLASVDALITKPGYGSFVEAVTHGLPVLYLDRPDWPEAPYLRQWLHAHTHAQEVAEADLSGPALLEKLKVLWAQPPLAKGSPGGVESAAQHLAAWLSA